MSLIVLTGAFECEKPMPSGMLGEQTRAVEVADEGVRGGTAEAGV